jgi:hypothetical protein
VTILELLAHAATAYDFRTLASQIFFEPRPTLSLTRVWIVGQPALRRLCFGAANRWIARSVGIMNIASVMAASGDVLVVEDCVALDGSLHC